MDMKIDQELVDAIYGKMAQQISESWGHVYVPNKPQPQRPTLQLVQSSDTVRREAQPVQGRPHLRLVRD